ncbi:hypothetical protein BJ085DRAFT_38345 [Dimargaris cristalligena]|uniref:RGS domain-containing protein n=1 Tax=Dimargaris cristalligena TaxID=215637 RepID=A0A4Q0A2F3_9FUNG|nr:hypothetical protein BJ085DRAFT_38345 [Dimargaris cristalligena]|eukprot:RKP40008.1 hypothetical protein BJ085DRAFT_38345 [Dimargaris cristalligena]
MSSPDPTDPIPSSPVVKFAVFGTVTGVAVLYVVITTALFYWRGQHIRDIQQRSMRLTMVQSFTILTQVILSGLGSMLNENVYPCFLLLWGMNFGCLLLTFTASARAIRLISTTNANQARIQHQLPPKAPPADDPLRWFRIHYQTLISEKYLLAYLLVLCIFTAVYDLLVNIYYDMFSLRPLGRDCKLAWPYYPMLAWVAIHILIIFPLVIRRLWKINDAYGIRTDLIVCCCASTIGELMFLVWQLFFRHYRNVVSSLAWFLLAMLVIHTSSVTLPVFRVLYHPYRPLTHTTSSDKTPNDLTWRSPNFNEFARSLNQPATLHHFKDMAVRCLCVEAVIFLEEYRELMDQLASTESSELNPILTHRLISGDDSALHLPSLASVDTYDQAYPLTTALSESILYPTSEYGLATSDLLESTSELYAGEKPTKFKFLQPTGFSVRSNPSAVLAFNMFAQRFFLPGSELLTQVKIASVGIIQDSISHGRYHQDMFESAHTDVVDFLYHNVYLRLHG